jgi:hypothetical protein
VVAVADVDIQDAGPDLEASGERELGAAVARALDAAILFGTDAPGSFPVGGIIGTAVTGTDALDKALATLEASGVMPTGIAAGMGINSALRQAPTHAPTLHPPRGAGQGGASSSQAELAVAPTSQAGAERSRGYVLAACACQSWKRISPRWTALSGTSEPSSSTVPK